LSLSGAPGRDWSNFECEREVDPQLERVDVRLSPRQAAAVAVQTMTAHAQSFAAGSSGLPQAKSPRTVIRSHRAQLDLMCQMLDDAPTADPANKVVELKSSKENVVDSGVAAVEAKKQTTQSLPVKTVVSLFSFSSFCFD
jgi:hypothetical protein